MTVPSEVTAAARAHRVRTQAPLVSRQVSRGDLRFITPPYEAAGDTRLALVLNVDKTLDFIEIALVHSSPELATSADGVVPGALAGTPYSVVIQTDLRGVVLTSVQASNLAGRLSEETMEEVSDLVETGRPESERGIRLGIPLRERHDRRWSFKASEGQALRALTGLATQRLTEPTNQPGGTCTS